MTLDKFFEELKKKPIEHYIVTLKYKHDFEKDYTIDNEILEVDMKKYPDCYVWLNDWNEGQTDVEVLGYIPVREVITDKGEWILDKTDNSITCNKCGCLMWASDLCYGDAHYCPNCGANMESEVRNEQMQI